MFLPWQLWATVFPCEFCEMFYNIFRVEHLRWLLLTAKSRSVCNFQSMESSVKLNRVLLKLFCYVTWFDKRPIFQILLFLRNNNFNDLKTTNCVNYFCKKALWQLFNWVLNRPLHLIRVFTEKIFPTDFTILKLTLR